jgi:hypothetical protein
MSCLDNRNFSVSAGATFLPTIRWGTQVMISTAITAIDQAVPVSITAVGHSIPDGWPVAVVGARGMTQINATRYPPVERDFSAATVASASVIKLNAVSSTEFSAYTSGGYLVYHTPMNLLGVTAIMIIRDAPLDGTILATLTEADGITLDNTLKTITPRLETAGLEWTLGYYDLEMTDTNGIVVQLLSGIITIE